MLYRVVSSFFVIVALSWVMSAHAQAADSHQGKVVETSAGKLVMTDKDGKKEHPMEVSAKATVTRDGKESKLTDLKAGDTITVTTHTKDGKAMVTKVEAKGAGM
jgi:co-chaperonin GroES (HSP10)